MTLNNQWPRLNIRTLKVATGLQLMTYNLATSHLIIVSNQITLIKLHLKITENRQKMSMNLVFKSLNLMVNVGYHITIPVRKVDPLLAEVLKTSMVVQWSPLMKAICLPLTMEALSFLLTTLHQMLHT
jgi:hypothetical protein